MTVLIRKWFLLSLLFIVPLVVGAQTKEIYVNPDFARLTQDEKTLAILPFEVTMNLRPKQKARITAGELADLEHKEAFAIQSALQTYFLKRKEKRHFSVDFQDIQQTNALLKQKHLLPDSLSFYSPAEQARILGVDGVVSGALVSDKPLSDGASIALGLLVGFSGPTNSGKCTISIHDRDSGKLVWKYDKTLSRGLGSDINTIINAIMRKASRKFPYEK